MTAKPLPALEELQSVLRLDATSPSGLRWIAPGKARRVGDVAGCKSPRGYWSVSFCRGGKPRALLAHRVVWALHTGEDPGHMQIDHANGDPSDNQVENLRLATQSQNNSNRAAMPGSSSRHCGVSWSTQKKRWRAQIRVDRRLRHIRYCRCETAAALAYDREALKCFGEFAAPNILSGGY